MSGRWLTTIAISVCLAFVAFAFWQRVEATRQVRAFWGAEQARLIQHAPVVQWHAGPTNSQTVEWLDLADAPGLIHLRATFVDDRNYQWSKLTKMEGSATSSIDSMQTLRFADKSGSVEFVVDAAQGLVINPTSGQAVPLTTAGQQAVAAYLTRVTLSLRR